MFVIKPGIKQASKIPKFIDLHKLLGNIFFLTVYIIAYNKLLLIIKNIFVNIKANKYLFINIIYAKKLCKLLQITIILLKNQAFIESYNN